MMIVLLLFTSTIAIFSFFMRKDIMNPIFIFNFVWSLIILLFEFQLFRTIEITNTTINILYCMMISFNLGALLYTYGKKKKKNDNDIVKESVFNEKLFIVLAAIAIVVLLIDEMEIIIKLLSGTTFEQIMAMSNGKGTVDIVGTFKVILYMFIVHPMEYIVSPVCAIQFLKNKKKKYLIINIILTLLTTVHHGGRNSIFLMIIVYIAVYLITKKQSKEIIHRKTKLRTKVIIILSAVVFTLLINKISSSRGIQDIWLSFYAYFICCIPLSSIYLKSYITSFIGHTGGMMSSNGIMYPLFSVLNYIGISSPGFYKNAGSVFSLIENNYVSIGQYTSTGTNYFMMAGAYPYIDGGFLFEFLVFFALGILMCYAYNKCYTNKNEKNIVIYCFCVIGMVFSFT